MNKYKVLLVDDEMLLLESLEIILELNNFEVIGKANDGNSALKILEDSLAECDIALVDLNMKGMGGIELIKIMKDKYPDIKVLVLTTFYDDKYITEAIANGADGYLLKDINHDGKNELIILPMSLNDGSLEDGGAMIYAVYTMQNGKPVRVLESWTRSRNYLCADGGIYNEGSDGASYSTWCIRDIKNGRIVVREGVQTADKMDANGEYLEGGVYLRMTESHKLYDGEEISEEQADADLERYQNMLLNDDSDFVPFAEYEKKSR